MGGLVGRTWCALVLALAVGWGNVASAIIVDSPNPGLDPDGTFPVADMPALGFRPDDDYVVRLFHPTLQPGGTAGFSGVPIGPNYVMAAQHQGPANWLDLDVAVGRETNAAAQFEIVDWFSYAFDDSYSNGGGPVSLPGAPQDVIILKIAPKAGGPPALSAWASFYRSPALDWISVAHGSHGPHQKRSVADPENPQLVGSPVPGKLVWGRTRTLVSTPPPYGNYTDPLNPYYLENQVYGHIPGDSGSPVYAKVGWEWEYFLGPQGFPAYRAPEAEIEWIEDAMQTMAEPGEAPIGRFGADVPTPSKTFQGAGSLPWSSSANWASGGAPSAVDIVRVAHATKTANIASGEARAQELFVGAGGVYGKITQSAGTLLNVAHSIYFAPESSDTADYIGSGDVTADNLHVGVYGDANFTSTGSSVSASTVFAGTRSGGIGEMTFTGQTAESSLTAHEIVLGFEQNAMGVLVLEGSSYETTVTSDLLLVGARGSGLVYQVTGSSVNTDRTQLGLGGTGVYQQSGGSHVTKQLQMTSDSMYELSGGGLSVTERAVCEGTIDCAGGSGSLSAAGIVDLELASLNNTGNAAVTVQPQSLLILPQGFAANAFGSVSVDATSVVHTSGQPLTIGSGKHIVGYGTIVDAVVVDGNGILEAGLTDHALRLKGNLTITGSGVVSLGYSDQIAHPEYQFMVSERSQTLDLRDGTFQSPRIIVDSGQTLTANGRIVIRNSAYAGSSSNSIIVEAGSTLEIGPGVNSLSLDGRLLLEAGSILAVDVGGTGLNASDSLEIDFVGTQSSSFHSDIQLHLANGFAPTFGDEIELIRIFDNYSGDFGDIIHDGPAQIGVEKVFSSGSGANPDTFSVRFVAQTPGDFDLDGAITGADIDLLYDNLGSAAFDLDGDDDADQADVDFLVADILGTVYGDADLDDDIDGMDFDAWRLRDSLGEPIGWATGDWDGDNDVDGADFDLWRFRPAAIAGGDESYRSVAEPATFVLWGIAAPGLSRICSKRRRRRGSFMPLSGAVDAV